MAEKIEVVKEEFPEGYVLYIIRGFRGLGILSIRSTPSGVDSGFSSEGRELKVKFAKVSVSFNKPVSINFNINSNISSTPYIKPLRPVPISVVFSNASSVMLMINDKVPSELPSTNASPRPIMVSFNKPGTVSLQLSDSYYIPQGVTYNLREVSVTFAQSKQVSLGSINYELPKLLNLRRDTTAFTAASSEYTYELSEGEVIEVEEVIDRVLFGLGRVVPDRALVIVARRIGGFGYIEFLKRVLREVYRVSIGGLPNPKHVSHSEDLTLLMPIEVGAGGRLFVIDLTSGNLRELLKDYVRLARIKERVKDRLRELFSQGFGFIVIYGDGGEDCDYTSNEYKNIKDSKKENKEDKACVSEFIKGMWIKFYGEKILEYHSTVPSPIEVNPVVEGLDANSSREFYTVLASVMWGRVSKPIADYSGFGGFNEFVVWLEDGYWRVLEGALRDFDIRLKVKPSAEGDEHSLESMSHYLTKATMVNYLIRELTEEFRSKGIEEDEARVKALECVETEYQLGNVRFDVYVKPNCGSRLDGLVVEVETLYGTGTVVHKVLDTVESRVKAGVNRLWVVVPNPQATILLPQLLKLERYVKGRYGEGVEFHTLDITETEPKPVRLIEAAKTLTGEWRRLKVGGGGGAGEVSSAS